MAFWAKNVVENNIFIICSNRYNMTQHIKTHFKEKGANSIFTNNNFHTMISSGLLSPDEQAYLVAVYEGRKAFDENDPENPFARNSPVGDGGLATGPAPLAAGIVT